MERQTRKYNVKGLEIDKKEELTTRGWYLTHTLKQLWKDEDTVEMKWEAVKLALSESAESTLGVENKRSPICSERVKLS